MRTRSMLLFVTLCTWCAAGCGPGPAGRDAAAPPRTEAEIRAANEAAGAVGTLMPSDESPRDEALTAFLGGMRAAIARRDSAALLGMVDPHIKASFGGDAGIADFRRMWFGPDAHGDLWQELGGVLAHGGTFMNDSTFIAPYIYSAWPDAFFAFDHVAVPAADIPLRAAPLQDAAVLATVSHAILALHPNQALANALDGWTVVDRGADTPAFVETRFVRSPVGYRAFFQRRAGTWRMSLFLAGD